MRAFREKRESREHRAGVDPYRVGLSAPRPLPCAPGPPTMGRPTKLTAELSDQLCALLADGWFLDHACAEVGVSRKVVYEWLEAAEKADASDLHTEFRDACERARSAGERKYLDRIADIAEESSVQYGRGEGKSRDWKAHAWRLERMNPSRYKETRRTEITGANGGPVVMEKGSIFIPPEADD